MKQNKLVLALMLASLLVAMSDIKTDGRMRVNSKKNQSDVKKTEPPKRVYDIYGKLLRDNEKYLAERTLKNGRIVAYRKNKREIAALIKALKENGVTDEKLLDPQAWISIICWMSVSSGCQGGCGFGKTCRGLNNAIEKVPGGGPVPVNPIVFCYCQQP